MAGLIGHAPSRSERVLVKSRLFGTDSSALVEGVS